MPSEVLHRAVLGIFASYFHTLSVPALLLQNHRAVGVVAVVIASLDWYPKVARKHTNLGVGLMLCSL